MIVELVQTQTSDGLRLHGALNQHPDVDGHAAGVVVCFHGVASNFYTSSMMATLASEIASDQYDVLRVNTRGRDNCCTMATNRGGTRMGAAYEIIDDCRRDVDAWIDLCKSRGYEQVVLLGHSLGAIKVIYAEANDPHEEVSQVIALSPPRLSHMAFINGPRSAEYDQSLAVADQAMAMGQPGKLIDITFPFPLLIAAGSYVDKYGPGERYNILEHVAHLRTPTQVCFGSEELTGSVAFEGLPELISERVAGSGAESMVTVDVVDGADHMYSQRRDELSTWVTRQLMDD